MQNSNLRLVHTLMIWSGVTRGRPTSDISLAPQLSNHWSPTHSANMWMTADCVIMLPILPAPKSTTGTLFILYLESNKSMVRNEFDLSKARNGAQRNVPEISRTWNNQIKFNQTKCWNRNFSKLGWYCKLAGTKPWYSYKAQKKWDPQKSFLQLLQQIQGLRLQVLEQK